MPSISMQSFRPTLAHVRITDPSEMAFEERLQSAKVTSCRIPNLPVANVSLSGPRYARSGNEIETCHNKHDHGVTGRLNWFCEGNVLIIHAVCCKGWIQTVKGFAWCSPVEILLPSYCFCNGKRWGLYKNVITTYLTNQCCSLLVIRQST